MNNLETKLQKLPVTPAPVNLDRRVAQTLRAHASRHHGVFSVHVPLWVCATACLVFFAVGMSFRQALALSASAPPEPIACSIEYGPAFAAVFAPESEPTDFFLRRKEQIRTHTTVKGT